MSGMVRRIAAILLQGLRSTPTMRIANPPPSPGRMGLPPHKNFRDGLRPPLAPAMRPAHRAQCHRSAWGTVSNGNVISVERSGQLELFGGEAVVVAGPDPDQMRAWLKGVLDEARTAETAPWPPAKARLYRLMFPQLSFWLPEDEGAQLRLQFETELERLAAA